jgi:hypothetical protein
MTPQALLSIPQRFASPISVNAFQSRIVFDGSAFAPSLANPHVEQESRTALLPGPPLADQLADSPHLRRQLPLHRLSMRRHLLPGLERAHRPARVGQVPEPVRRAFVRSHSRQPDPQARDRSRATRSQARVRHHSHECPERVPHAQRRSPLPHSGRTRRESFIPRLRYFSPLCAFAWRRGRKGAHALLS